MNLSELLAINMDRPWFVKSSSPVKTVYHNSESELSLVVEMQNSIVVLSLLENGEDKVKYQGSRETKYRKVSSLVKVVQKHWNNANGKG